MRNCFKELKEIEKEDPIEQVNVLGKDGLIKEFKSIDEAKDLLDRNFEGGFGAPESPDFIAWGIEKIYFNSSYAGADALEEVPRNPCVFIPFFHNG